MVLVLPDETGREEGGMWATVEYLSSNLSTWDFAEMDYSFIVFDRTMVYTDIRLNWI